MDSGASAAGVVVVVVVEKGERDKNTDTSTKKLCVYEFHSLHQTQHSQRKPSALGCLGRIAF